MLIYKYILSRKNCLDIELQFPTWVKMFIYKQTVTLEISYYHMFFQFIYIIYFLKIFLILKYELLSIYFKSTWLYLVILKAAYTIKILFEWKKNNK